MKKPNIFVRLREDPAVIEQLLLTSNQRKVVFKWLLFTAGFLLLQTVQDVILSRVQILGGCPDVVPGYLLLVCLTQEESSGILFLMCCSVFRCLTGTVLGAASLAVLVFTAVLLGMLRRGYLWGQVRSVLLCTWLGLAVNEAVLFCLGIFLGHTAPDRIPQLLGGLLGACAAAAVLYIPVVAIGKIGGNGWKD